MKNWKTTLCGMLGAIASVVIPLITSGTVSTNQILTAAALAGIGYFSKDKDVTGGTKQQ